jgi:hypothetical protein
MAGALKHCRRLTIRPCWRVIDAVSDFETRGPFDFFEIRKNAERFSETRFREEFKAVIEQTMNTELIKRCGP